MDSHYLTCLDNIIELEKSVITQEKTINDISEKIDELAITQDFTEPCPPDNAIASVHVKYISRYISRTDHLFMVIGFSMMFLFVGIPLANYFEYDLILFFAGVIGAILGEIAFRVLTAQINQEKKYEIDIIEQNYQYELHQYNQDVTNERKRMKKQLVEIQKLKELSNELTKKLNATQTLLTQYYDAASIYETYRNLIAICHISEYLKSGICTELTGTNGAFMVFKYEMFEKQKIERLDNIMTKLDQIHFDNQILNRTLQEIGADLNYMIGVSEDIRQLQTDNLQETRRMQDKLDHMIEQNNVNNYIQRCNEAELHHIRWLEEYNTFLK